MIKVRTALVYEQLIYSAENFLLVISKTANFEVLKWEKPIVWSVS